MTELDDAARAAAAENAAKAAARVTYESDAAAQEARLLAATTEFLGRIHALADGSYVRHAPAIWGLAKMRQRNGLGAIHHLRLHDDGTFSDEYHTFSRPFTEYMEIRDARGVTDIAVRALGRHLVSATRSVETDLPIWTHADPLSVEIERVAMALAARQRATASWRDGTRHTMDVVAPRRWGKTRCWVVCLERGEITVRDEGMQS